MIKASEAQGQVPRNVKTSGGFTGTLIRVEGETGVVRFDERLNNVNRTERYKLRALSWCRG